MIKRVCMISYSNYLTDARVRREAETLAATERYEVTVLVPRMRIRPDRPDSNEPQSVTVEQLDVPNYYGDNFLAYGFYYLKFFFLLLWHFTLQGLKGRVDIVHVHNMPNFFVFSALLPRLAGKPVVLDVHDTLIETFVARLPGTSLSKRILRLLFRLEEYLSCLFASRIICVNDVQKDVLVGRGIPSGKITVLLNVPDPRIFDYESRFYEASRDGSMKLVYHGTLTRRLGVDLVIDAMKRVVAQGGKVEFHVIGAGDDKEFLENQRARLGMEEIVHFHPIASLADLPRLLSRMDLEVLANRRSVATELMLPVKMLECVALGIPVVAPELKAIRTYFTDDMIFFFKPDDTESLSEAILLALRNPEMRKRKAASAKRFLAEYGWGTHKERLLDLYRHL